MEIVSESGWLILSFKQRTLFREETPSLSGGDEVRQECERRRRRVF
jgi:hypothetical protein